MSRRILVFGFRSTEIERRLQPPDALPGPLAGTEGGISQRMERKWRKVMVRRGKGSQKTPRHKFLATALIRSVSCNAWQSEDSRQSWFWRRRWDWWRKWR